MPLAVHLLVVQEHAVRGPRAHEVVVAGAGGETAAYGGTRLLTELASLANQNEPARVRGSNISRHFPPPHSSVS